MAETRVRGGKHCRFCKEGRIVEIRHKDVVFCSLCGHEFMVK